MWKYRIWRTKLKLTYSHSKYNENLKEVKDIVNNLKTTITPKENYALKSEDKDMLTTYIDSVSKTNNKFKKALTLSITLNNADKELKKHRKMILN